MVDQHEPPLDRVVISFSAMSWQSKETLTIFDQYPIPGLFYLDGDQYSRVLERDATIAQLRVRFDTGIALYAIELLYGPGGGAAYSTKTIGSEKRAISTATPNCISSSRAKRLSTSAQPTA